VGGATSSFLRKARPRDTDAGASQIRVLEEYRAVSSAHHRCSDCQPESGTARGVAGAMKPLENQLASVSIKSRTVVVDAQRHLVVESTDVNFDEPSFFCVTTRIVKKNRNELI
jgi:hypothetical protein